MNSKYTFFWSGPFSNWAKTKFVYKGVEFSSSEQAMMWEKANLFGDTETADKILNTSNPREQKQLGREVKGYDDTKWSMVRKLIVFDIVLEKFRQDKSKQADLLATGDTILVEASPVDKIWGIGLAEDDPDANDETKWRGQNLLGEVLTIAREVIRVENNDMFSHPL